jgi:CheY-like chemotaxis protein
MPEVLVVDDHPIALQGCRRILEDVDGTTVFEASALRQAMSFFAATGPTWSSSTFPCGMLVSRGCR